MTPSIALVFALVIAALVLFAWEAIPYDVVALLILATLATTGIVSPADALAGFSNAATITIAAMFVLSAGLKRTGAIDQMGELFRRLGKGRPWLGLSVMMVVIAIASGFINNTAAIAIFIPIALSVAVDLGVSPSKLLMPLSFASMFGGVCTLLGTSTNILVSGIAEKHGLAPFSMFEFTPLGVLFAVVGFAYLGVVGVRLVPARRDVENLTDAFGMPAYITDVQLRTEGKLVGEEVRVKALKDLDVDVVQIFRGDRSIPVERAGTLEPSDVLRVRGSASAIRTLLLDPDIVLQPGRPCSDRDFEVGRSGLLEAVLAPDSNLTGRTFGALDLYERFEALLLAVRRRGELQQSALDDVRLRGGDSVLLFLPRERFDDVERGGGFVVTSELAVQSPRRTRMPIAVLILVTVVALAGLGLLSPVISAVSGGIALIITGCLTPEEAYEAINWKVIMLLAGVLPLGTALDQTGAADLVSQLLTATAGAGGPVATLAVVFGLAMALTNLVSNQATAALLAPVVISAATTLDVDPRPFLVAVTMAASLSFLTPFGYQTNTLVYGPGNYRFGDYARVGAPLNLLFWVLAVLAIPWLWPF